MPLFSDYSSELMYSSPLTKRHALILSTPVTHSYEIVGEHQTYHSAAEGGHVKGDGYIKDAN